MASVTKTLTALLAARLFVDGVVAWDDPLSVLGETPSPVSLRTLLSHTSGLPFELHPAHWETTSLSERELSSALARPPRLQIPPGTSHYSNRDALARTWWWDGQAIIEPRYGHKIELVLSEKTWPFPLFSGRANGHRLIGVDWRGRPLELLDRGDSLIGAGTRLTADVADSAHTNPMAP